jgi:SAM-dependent methyltransferase
MYEAEDTHWWYRGLRGMIFELLGLNNNRMKQRRILDAGCGTGGTMHTLQLSGYRNLWGFDISPIALEFCRERGLRNVRQGSITDIPFDCRSFDLAISCDVISDAGTEDEMAALGELFRVLKPGGRLFLNLPAFEFLRGEHDRAVATARRTTRPDIRRKLAVAGFRVKRATYWNMLLLPFVAAIRLARHEKQDASRLARSDIVVPPAPVNALLSMCTGLERFLIRWVDLPVGSSVAIVAIKPKSVAESNNRSSI